MEDIKGICPWCEGDMTVTVRELLNAQRYAKAQKKPLLLTHGGPEGCCRVVVVGEINFDQMTEAELIAYVAKQEEAGEETCLPCLKPDSFETNTLAKQEEAGEETWLPCLKPDSFETNALPGGRVTLSGVDLFKSPAASDLKPPRADGWLRREFMEVFGFDPACWYAKKDAEKAKAKPGKTPIKIGGK